MPRKTAQQFSFSISIYFRNYAARSVSAAQSLCFVLFVFCLCFFIPESFLFSVFRQSINLMRQEAEK